MPSLIPSDLPTIMQAVEQQLLTYVSPITEATVVGDISNVYWVFKGEEPPPGETGQRDILLAEHGDEFTNIQGAGRLTEIKSGLDIYLRMTLASDRKGTHKQYMIKQRQLVNALMDAMMGFFPVDEEDNALTIEGFCLGGAMNAAGNNDPRTVMDVTRTKATTWGQLVSSFSFHYVPNIDLSYNP